MTVTINVVSRLDDYALKRAQAEMLGLGKAAIRSDSSMAGAFLRTGATLSALSTKLKAVGTGMSMYVTLPLAAIGYESVKSAMKFQSSMALIKTQAGGTAGDVKVLSAAILGMKDVQYGPNELAAAMYHLKSVGMDNKNAMVGLRVATEGAAVGQADLEQTTSVLAAAWKSGVKGAGTFKDAMAETNAIVGAGNMRMNDLVSALSTGILGSAKIFGVSMQSVGSALDVMADRGLPATRAATGLRMAISMMGSPSKAAATMLNSLGIKTLELGTDMRRPDGLLVAMQDLHDHLAGLSQEQQAFDLSKIFGGGRTSSAAMMLIGNLDALATKYKQVGKTAGDFTSEVATQAKTVSAQWAESKASLESSAILIGNDLMPLVLEGAHAIDRLAEAFQGMSPSTRRFVVDCGLVAAAVGPVAYVLAGLTKIAASASTGIGMLMLKLNSGSSVGAGATGLGGTLNKILGRGGAGAGSTAGMVATDGGAASAGVPVVLVGAAAAASAALTGGLIYELATYREKRNAPSGATLNPKGVQGGAGAHLTHSGASVAGMYTPADAIENLSLIIPAQTRSGVENYMELLNNLHKLETQPEALGPVQATHTARQLVNIRANIISSLHITAAQANAVMNSIFGKQWDPAKDMQPSFMAAENALQAEITKWKKLGLSLTGGLAAGVVAGNDYAVKTVEALASGPHGMTTQFAEQVQSHSPSRVFYQFGQYITEGLANGITESASGPLSAIAKLGKEVAAALGAITSATDSALGGIGSAVAGAAGGGGKSGGGSVGSGKNVATGKKLAAKYGWNTGQQWADLDMLWERESGWNNTAQNPTSTAYGIAQFLDSTWSGYTYAKTSDPTKQIVDGLEYIKRRYGTPAEAWAHETRIGWYDQGGVLPPGLSLAYNGTGHDEIHTSGPGRGPTVINNYEINPPPGLMVGDYEDFAQALWPWIERMMAHSESRHRGVLG